MTDAARQRLAALSKQLVEGIPDEGTFEDIPKIRHVAEHSPGQRVKGKVVVVTGKELARCIDFLWLDLLMAYFTGANGPIGIGRASAHQFANNGARAIYICDFASNHLETHKREIESLYPNVDVHTRKFDVADEAAVKAVCEEAISTYGRLDIMFANAGIVGKSVIFSEISAEEFQRTLQVNTIGVFNCFKHGAIAMQKTSKEKPYPRGSLIGTSSVAGLRANAGSTDYSASKAAVVSMAQTMAYQLAGTGVRANAICPGLIETGMTLPMYQQARARGTEKKVGQLNPTGRGALADEVARVALFLGSDEASYVNGQAWAVCGGLSAGHPFVPGKLG